MIKIQIIKIDPENTCSNYNSPVVSFVITNNGDEDIIFDHSSSKYFIEIHKGSDVLVLDESMRLRMLFSRSTRVVLEPEMVSHNSAREFTMNIAEFYYPFSEGSYSIYACCKINDQVFRSSCSEFTVFQTKIVQDYLWYENPIFGNYSLLSKSIDEYDNEEYFLRWLNPDRPLASNFTKKIKEIPAESEIIVATPNFFTLDAFEPSFEKFIVCFDKKDTIQVVHLFMGETQKLSPAIKFDKEVVLLPFSFRNEKNEITIFTLDGDRKVNCFNITSDYSLKFIFSFTFDYSLVKYGLKKSLFITGGPDLIHIISFGNGLVHSILDYHGNRVKENLLSRHRDVPVYLNASLVKNTIKVIYYAGNNNYTFFQSSFSGIDGKFSKIEKKIRLIFGLDELIEDIDFLYNKDSALQLVYSTTSGRLIYGDEYIGFKTVLKNKNIRYPRLIAGDNEMFRPFLGFSTPKNGYRFYNIEGPEPWRKLQSVTI